MPIITVPFPLKGFNKNWAYSQQPPLTTSYMKNMRPYDVTGESRCRGGSSVSPPEPSDHSEIEAFGTTYGVESDYPPNAPAGASVIALYRGRVVLAGPSGGSEYLPDALRRTANKGEGNETSNDLWDDYQWAMSRQGDAEDWDFCANDAQTPIAGSCCDAGRVPDKITALAPFSDDYLIVGCKKSIWVIRGDPAWGGSIDNIMSSDGIFNNNAWCFDQNGNFYFANITGIYVIPRGLGPVKNISKDKIPDIFRGMSEAHQEEVNLAYDYENGGISISCEGADPPAVDYDRYWYDFRTDGFFPEDYNVSESSQSEVMYGPIAMGTDECQRGKITNLSVTTGGGNNVNYSIYTADSAAALKALVESGTGDSKSGVLAGFGRMDVIGPNPNETPDDTLNKVGAYLAIKFYGTGFVLENVVVEIEPVGELIVTHKGKAIGNPITPLVRPDSTTYGPFAIAGEGFTKGKITKLSVASSADVEGCLYVGNSKLEVTNLIGGEADWNDDFSKNKRSDIAHPNVSGICAALVFDKDTIEEVTIGVEPVGELNVTYRGQTIAKIEPVIGPSSTTYGPFAIVGEGFTRGKITELAVASSENVGCSIFVGNSELDVTNKIAGEADWSDGIVDNNILRPNVSGTYAAVVFDESVVEAVKVGVEPVGQLSITHNEQFIDKAVNPVVDSASMTFGPVRIVGSDFSKAKITEMLIVNGQNTTCKLYVGHSEFDVKEKISLNSPDWQGQSYSKTELHRPNVSGVYAAIVSDSPEIENVKLKVEPIGQLVVTHQAVPISGKLNPVIGSDGMTYGPFAIVGEGFNKGKITDLTVVQAEDSRTIHCTLYVANSETEVREKIGSSGWCKSFHRSGEKSRVEHPDIAGVYALLVFDKPLIENVIIGVEPVGVLTVTYQHRSPRFVQPVIGPEYTVYEPFSTGGKYGKAGKITELSIAKSSGSSNIDCYLFADNSLMEVRNAMPNRNNAKWHEKLVAGKGCKLLHRPHIRAGFAALLFDNSDIEEVRIDVSPAGNLRML